MVESWLVDSLLEPQTVVGLVAREAQAGTVALAAERELAEIVDSVTLGKENKVAAEYCRSQCFAGIG